MADYDRLKKQIEGDILKSSFDRGRYATDASIYQIMPQAVMVPKTWQDVEAALDFAKAEGISLLPRGGGTSQSGQTVNDALVIDFTKHLNSILDYDADAGTATVQPGLVLDNLNRQLKSMDGGILLMSQRHPARHLVGWQRTIPVGHVPSDMARCRTMCAP